MTTHLDIQSIRTDGGTQPRAELDFVTVADYADDMRAGSVFPPVVVFYDGSAYWLADGYHRLAAVQQLGEGAIAADVRQGTLDDARWFSYGVNKDHGLRRSNEDKRRAVEAALQHPFSGRYSSNQIAAHCGVSHTFVDKLRGILQPLQDSVRSVTRNGTTYEMQTANIGQRENGTPPAMPFVPTADDYADPYGDDEPELFEVATPAAPTYAPISDRESYDGDEWKTPPVWIETARAFLGTIDLDPASNHAAQNIVQATVYHTKDTDGLNQVWCNTDGTPARVWCNPPYSTQPIKAFAQKMIEEYDAGRMLEGLLLVNNCTDTGWFFDLAMRFPMMFSRGRVRFWYDHPDDETPTRQGQTIFYFGKRIGAFYDAFEAARDDAGRPLAYVPNGQFINE